MSNTQSSSGTIFSSLLLKDLFYNAVIPYILYVFLLSQHVSMLNTLLIAAIPPVFTNLKSLSSQKRVNMLGVLALVAIVAGLCGYLLFNDARLSLLSGSVLTGLYGIILLVSLLLGRPLLSVIALDILARNDPTQREQLKQNARFFSFMRLLTIIWGATLLIEALARVVLAYSLSLPQFLLLSPFVQYGIFGVGLLWTLFYVYLRKKSKAPEATVQQVAR